MFPAETGGVAKRCAGLSVGKDLTGVKKNRKKVYAVRGPDRASDQSLLPPPSEYVSPEWREYEQYVEGCQAFFQFFVYLLIK